MDPIADMLNSFLTAGAVGKEKVVVAHSKQKEAICDALKNHGYVKGFSSHVDGAKKTLEIALSYKGKAHVISGLKRISKPSKRVYVGTREINPVKYGHGIAVLSTPKGILTDKEARKELVGGELLFTMW